METANVNNSGSRPPKEKLSAKARARRRLIERRIADKVCYLCAGELTAEGDLLCRECAGD